jgi:predicted nuclease of restriction endonuclease-like (RecB) superfamily
LWGRKIPAYEQFRLYSYLAFYRTYPQIRDSVSPELLSSDLGQVLPSIFRSVIEKSPSAVNGKIFRSVTEISPVSGKLLLAHLSFTHLELLSAVEDPFKRAFYEVECIKGNWSVRKLKRQIASFYFERSGLSLDVAKLSALANAAAVQAEPRYLIRDLYVFEFLGLKPCEVLPESDLEAALIEKMQTFLLELGHGFCFEARYKRLIIGGEHVCVELVF